MNRILKLSALAILLGAVTFCFGQGEPSRYPGGAYVTAYNHWSVQVASGNSATGTQTILMKQGMINLPDGRIILPFAANAPITIDPGTANSETVTPTSVSGCGIASNPAQPPTCAITASFSNIHGPGGGAFVISGSFGLQEAINDCFNPAQPTKCGEVTVGPDFQGTDATLSAAVPYSMVVIRDVRNGTAQTWTGTQTVATLLAAPATLTNATAGFGVAGANFTGGAYTGSSTYIACIAYVDIMGNEGPCSATFTIATSGAATTDQIGFTAPAASTGAVGYTIYIDLAGGTYNLTYQVPLTSTVCTLTRVETVTPACAVTNATYGQSGSAAIVSALTVNTAPLHLLATTASTTAAYIGTPSGRTTYAYVPHNNVGAPGITASQQAYTISPAPGSTVPTVIGTFPIPPGFMNLVGRTIRICGQATNASGGTATVQNIEILWDAAGSNTAGAPVIIGQMQITATQASSPENYQFCWTGQTTVSGAGVTAGSIMPVSGVFNTSEAAGTLHSSGPDIKAAAVGSLNLAGTGGNTQRIHVVWLHTTGTDAAGTTLQGLTVEVI